jgi:hypothetical protein
LEFKEAGVIFDLKYLRYSSSRSRSSRLLFNLDFAFLVSMLQLTGCPPQAFSRTTAVLRTFVFMSFRMLRTICCTKQFMLLQMTPLLANILDQDHRILAVSFTVIAFVLRAISSPCRYCYPPRSTEPILWSSSCCSTDHVTLSLSLYSPIVAAAIISVSQVILSLSSCRCLRTSSLSSSTSTSRITASKPRRSSAPREGVLS